MSYCRFSSDDFKSDVYLYYSVFNCYTLHIAGARAVSSKPRPSVDKVYAVRPPKGAPRKEVMAWSRKLQAANKALIKWLDNAKRVPIKNRYAGQTLDLRTAREVYYKLLELKNLGYHVPDYAIKAIRDEAEREGEV